MKRAWIPILSPLFLLMTLRGLRTLRSLRILTILSLLEVIAREMMDTITTMKSMTFQPFLRKAVLLLRRKPKVIILNTDSLVKKMVRMMSV